ncbi:glycosyltransferase family protein [Lachnospiraceae bacterium ZAX-1]
MDNQKFCFIICTNHEIYEKECIHYIEMLHIPKGYEIDVLCIKGATSMTSGYNEGMKNTDAKYKIYLHQDVFIINQNLLYDILKLCEDETVGMIGVVGNLTFRDVRLNQTEGVVGTVYLDSILFAKSCLYGIAKADYCEVEVLDGLLMITQFDLPWREDIFTKWDFYDCSQSREYQRKGYKVVVPKMEMPWCIHDLGFLNLEHYHSERETYIKEYKEFVD